MSETEARGPRSIVAFVLEAVFVRLRFALILVATGLAIGYWDTLANHLESWRHRREVASSGAEAIEYFCPMHPGVVRDAPGKCPICGMPLSQRKKEAKGEVAALPSSVLARVQIAPSRIALSGIATSTVARRPLETTIETVGTIDVDERRLAKIAARISGRVDRLFVDFTGTQVRAGDPLVWIYSPDLSTSIDELRVAHERVATLTRDGASLDALRPARTLEDAARQRLVLWGMSPEQVERILSGKEGETHVEMLSPRDGTVIAKPVVAGQYVQEGTELYQVADLSLVWLDARVFEEDSGLVRVGLPVTIAVRALPGESFHGTVAFVDPVLDPETRTLRVRIDVPNDGRLRPGDYADATIRVPLGKVDVAPVAPAASCRKIWTCSMHPEVVRDGPGECPVCGMTLEPREVLSAIPDRWGCLSGHPPYLADAPGKCPLCGKPLVRVAQEPLLAVPASAVIDTGKRRVVYREDAPGVFDAISVRLGPRAGEYYPVLSGLAEGETVATAGAFLIDAETRLDPAAASAYFGASGSGGGR